MPILNKEQLAKVKAKFPNARRAKGPLTGLGKAMKGSIDISKKRRIEQIRQSANLKSMAARLKASKGASFSERQKMKAEAQKEKSRTISATKILSGKSKRNIKTMRELLADRRRTTAVNKMRKS